MLFFFMEYRKILRYLQTCAYAMVMLYMIFLNKKSHIIYSKYHRNDKLSIKPRNLNHVYEV